MEHLKLFILKTQRKFETFKARSKLSVNNLEIFVYVNSKFVHRKTYQNSINEIILKYNSAKIHTGKANTAKRFITFQYRNTDEMTF